MATGTTELREVLSYEKAQLVQRRERAGVGKGDSRGPVGLALSGGGIRSASFNLGLIQALVARGLFRHFDYLSTVSGGGYIGAFISSMATAGKSLDDIKPTTAQGGRQPERVARFIHGGKYLRGPLGFFNHYLIGLVLTNLVLISGLAALAALVAWSWRLLDAPMARDLLSYVALDNDLAAAFLPSGILFVAWLIAWISSYFRRHRRAEGRVARVFLFLFLPSLLVGFAVFLGNGRTGLGGITGWTQLTELRSQWEFRYVLMAVIGLALLPSLRPSSLLESGRRPRTVVQKTIFHVTSYALLVGIPFLVIGYFARENISGVATNHEQALRRSDLIDANAFWSQILGKRPDASFAAEVIRGQLELSRNGADIALATVREAVLTADRRAQTVSMLEQRPFIERIWQLIRHPGAIREGVMARIDERVRMESALKTFNARIIANVEVTRRLLEIETLAGQIAALKEHSSDAGNRLDRLVNSFRVRELNGGENATPTDEIKEMNILLLQAFFPKLIRDQTDVSTLFVLNPDQRYRLRAFAVALVVFVVSAVTIDFNATSLHGYYRARLADAYIEPRKRADGRPDSTITLAELHTVEQGCPYHLMSAALNNIGRARDLEAAASLDGEEYVSHFLLSQGFCGSTRTGYQRTTNYPEMDLANATAISGAALNPVQIDNPLLALVALVLNLRLGQWIPAPRHPRNSARITAARMLAQLIRRKGVAQRYCFLTDGGHDDNTGLSPLIRRRCRFVLFSDVSQDGGYLFADFARFCRRAAATLGVTIEAWEGGELDVGAIAPLGVRTTDASAVSRAYPRERSANHFILGRIRYPREADPKALDPQGPSEGILLYVKPTLTGNEPFPVREYSAENPEFPHDATAEQSYELRKFESYRALGQHIGEEISSLLDAFLAEQQAVAASFVEPAPAASAHTQPAPDGAAPIEPSVERRPLIDGDGMPVRAADGLEIVATFIGANGVGDADSPSAGSDDQPVAARSSRAAGS